MTTRTAVIILALMGIGASLWLRSIRLPRSPKPPVVSHTDTVVSDSQFHSEKAEATEPETRLQRPPPAETMPSIPTRQMDRTPITSDPAAATNLRLPQPFRLQGSGSTAKIVDSRGNAVLNADPKVGIYGCSVDPTGRRILVYRGNSDYDIFDPATKSKIVLPQQPRGPKKLAFSAWHWIDYDTVLGETGDELPGGRSGEGEDTMAMQGKLYLYNISRQELAEVNLPSDLGTKVFSVSQVSPDGYVRLVSEKPNSTGPTELGWFKLRPN